MKGAPLLKCTLPSGAPIVTQDIYYVQDEQRVQRVVATTTGSQVDLVLAVLGGWTDRIVIGVEVKAERHFEPGFWRSPLMRRSPDAAALLDRFRDFLEQDARLELHLLEVEGNRRIVLDDANLVYFYHDNDRVLDLLQARGFVPGYPWFEDVHTHHFHVGFDDDARAFLARFDWERLPDAD